MNGVVRENKNTHHKNSGINGPINMGNVSGVALQPMAVLVPAPTQIQINVLIVGRHREEAV